jgi:hypothetical protein
VGSTPTPGTISFRYFNASLSKLLPITNAFRAYTQHMSDSKLAIVASYGTEGEAEVSKGLLESSGIDAMVQADTAGRMREHLAWSGLGHRLLVREEDASAAREILGGAQNGEFVLLQKYLSEAEVDFPQGALLSAGIFATIQDDGTYHQLLVGKEDEVAARKVLAALPKSQP